MREDRCTKRNIIWVSNVIIDNEHNAFEHWNWVNNNLMWLVHYQMNFVDRHTYRKCDLADRSSHFIDRKIAPIKVYWFGHRSHGHNDGSAYSAQIYLPILFVYCIFFPVVSSFAYFAEILGHWIVLHKLLQRALLYCSNTCSDFMDIVSCLICSRVCGCKQKSKWY